MLFLCLTVALVTANVSDLTSMPIWDCHIFTAPLGEGAREIALMKQVKRVSPTLTHTNDIIFIIILHPGFTGALRVIPELEVFDGGDKL